MRGRALVVQPRVPAIDEDAGSQVVEGITRFLVDDGWSVTFLATDDSVNLRHVRRLRQYGVATFNGMSKAPEVLAQGQFDLAVLAFWEPASRLLPLIRESSPQTRVIVHSIDMHFVREARRRLGLGTLAPDFGGLVVQELNTYSAADAVLAVSEKETQLVSDFLGPGRAYHLPMAELAARSTTPVEQRRGMLFVGNFRHLPNGEALEYLCRDVIPLVNPDLLDEHPLTVVGNRMDDNVRARAAGCPQARLVGWVPSVVPYLERTRMCVVPLLHGAGVKGKVIQALMSGTPVVTTPIGAEGLELRSEHHTLIGDTPAAFARAITRVLTDADLWQRLADGGIEHMQARHGVEHVRTRFLEIVDQVLGRAPSVTSTPDGFRHGRRREEAYRRTRTAAAAAVAAVTDPGSLVLVTSKGDDDLLALEGRTGRHFPQGPDGDWAGFHPVDSDEAIRHLEALRAGGARYLVFPDTAFWWMQHYRELTTHLDRQYRRVHADDSVVIFDLGGSPRPRVLVLGTYGSDRQGPPADLVAELDRSARYAVTQRWESRDGWSIVPSTVVSDGPDWQVLVDDNAVLPPGFLDDFLSLATEAGAERAQPAHTGGPAAGPPVTERLAGCIARTVTAVTPLPVLAVRAGAAPDGPVLVLDSVPIGLARQLREEPRPVADSRVLDVHVEGSNGPVGSVRRGAVPQQPLISVLVSTFDRPGLLGRCLESFTEQTLVRTAFAIVVVDDGSPGEETTRVLERFGAELPLVWVRIEHAGRSAAKNLAVLLARADIVLFFDDDDRPFPDLLEKHIGAHRCNPGEGVAILGHTGWAPELVVTPLMHYLTEVDRMLFAYGNLSDGQELDWRGFWEGRISCKRSLLVGHGLHDQRLNYSIDVEMAWRLAPRGLRVIYEPTARSYMAREITFDDFCRRIEGKGAAQAVIASLHGAENPDILRYTKAEGAAERWLAARRSLDDTVAQVRLLEAEIGDDAHPADPRLGELHRCYRTVFGALEAKGLTGSTSATRASTARPLADVHRDGDTDGLPSELTVIIPVWSVTPELADMAVRTVDRIREVARIPTEIIVIDNGSPHERPLNARVHRFDENRGVSRAWNAGVALARTPVVAILNSDCTVEPGWDEALLRAATDGRRIAFPYTDHGDELGFRLPDQGGTAGWCFMLTLDLYREIGPFDEQFSPAYGEDTDYWHRAWKLGIELSPVPAARVTHARRTTARHDPHVDWLLMSHRYLYGWKHGVDPLRPRPTTTARSSNTVLVTPLSWRHR